MNKFSSVIGAINRGDSAELQIATFSTHETYQDCMAKTGHWFYHLPAPEGKKWDKDYRKVPPNIVEIEFDQLQYIDHFDLVISQTMNQRNVAQQIAGELNIPVISMQHVLPDGNMTDKLKKHLKSNDNADKSVFISDYARDEWGYKEDECAIVKQVVDDKFFHGYHGEEPVVLTVSNEFQERGGQTGFPLWVETVKALSKGADTFRLVGKNKDISDAAKDIDELRDFYRKCRVYFNPASRSTFPMTVLEAMATGMPVVSTLNGSLADFAQTGVNGFWSNDTKELHHSLEKLLNDRSLARSIGMKGQEDVKKLFGIDLFVDRWNEIFKSVLIN